MADARNFRAAPVTDEALRHNGGGRSTSHRLAQISDRYLHLLREAERAGRLTKDQRAVALAAMSGERFEPAAQARAIVLDRIRSSHLLGPYDANPFRDQVMAAVAALTDAEIFEMIEAVEARDSKSGP